MRDAANRRTDRYGGSVAGRARFLLEVVTAVAAVGGGDRVGVQISPTSALHDMHDADPVATFGYLTEQRNSFGLAYLHVFEPIALAPAGPRVTPELRARFRRLLIVNGGYDRSNGEAAIAGGAADLVSFGRPFIANPDLPERFAASAPLAEPDRSAFYGGGERGYTDYPGWKRTGRC